MTIKFLPGEPNRSPQACSFANWNSIQILAYISGNNLVILTKNCHHLQTIYLPGDAFAVDVNRVNGKIALAIQDEIYIYTPTISNFYNFNFSGRKDLDLLGIEWSLERKLRASEDHTKINCISWSDLCEFKDDEADAGRFLNLPKEFNTHTSCELVAGSDSSLTLWRLYYKKSHIEEKGMHLHSRMLWHMRQPNPVYTVKFSPNSTCIVSIGLCDRLVKLWYRLSYGIETADFELHYIPHPSVVTSLRWKSFPNLDFDGSKRNANANRSASTVTSGTAADSSSRHSSVSMNSSDSSTLGLNVPSTGLVKVSAAAEAMRNENKNRNGGGSSGGRKRRGTSDKRQHNILYTVTADSTLRIFATYKLQKGFEITRCGSIDLHAEDDADDTDATKFVTFIDSGIVEYGLKKVMKQQLADSMQDLAPPPPSADSTVRSDILQNTAESAREQALEDMLQQSLDICMVFDSNSRCRLYCMTNLNDMSPSTTEIYRMDRKIGPAGESTPYKIQLGKNCMPSDCRSINIQHLLTSTYSNETELTMAIQDLFKNTIRIVGFTFKSIFDFIVDTREFDGRTMAASTRSPTALASIGSLQDKLAGHNKSIRHLIRSTDGAAILSTTRFNENFLWFTLSLGHGQTTLNKKSAIITPSPVIKAAICLRGDFVVTLVDGKLICYDCRLQSQYHSDEATKAAPAVCSIDVDTTVKPMTFFIPPEDDFSQCRVVAVYPDKSCKAWTIKFPVDSQKASASEFKISSLPGCEDDQLHMAIAVDPVGWTTPIDAKSRDMLTIISKDGHAVVYLASVDEQKSEISWHIKDAFMTNIVSCSSLSGSSIHKLAIVSDDLKTLSIWDTRLGTRDYEESFDEPIQDIDWTATKYHQGILSVGFGTYCYLYTQLRYDYTNDSPNFAQIKKVSISEQTTHDIGDTAWMENGMLVLGSGNQFYISDKQLDPSDEITSKAIGSLDIVTNDLFHLCSALNGPLPLYHPQFIIQLLLMGRFVVVELILCRLCKYLREHDLGETSSIDPTLGLDYSHLVVPNYEDDPDNRKNPGATDPRLRHADSFSADDSDSQTTFTADIASTLADKLQKYKLPYLTGHQQITLSYTIGILEEILLKYRKILDYNALRYYLGIKLFQINTAKQLGGKRTEKTITMRDVTFGFHSDNKDLLYNMINDIANSKLDWSTSRQYGLAYWLSLPKLLEAMEKIGRDEFLKYQDENDGKKNPSKSALFYLALHKKQILLGLWKTASGNPEQTKMVKFLSNDFTEERWRKAAVKNAYVLLAKHRYVDAAYFFLLGDSLNEACDVITRKLEDTALAIAVARSYMKSDHSKELQKLLLRHVLPEAIDTNNRWSISWCFWAFSNRHCAIQCLIKPIEDVIQDIRAVAPEFEPPSNAHKVNTVNNEDPVLLVMYNNMRNKNVEYYDGALQLAAGVEFDYVVLSSVIYQRMGCDWISMYFARNWKFISDAERESSKAQASHIRASTPVAEAYVPKKPHNLLDDYEKSSQPTGYSNSAKPASLLDSFSGSSMLDDYMSPQQQPSAPVPQKPVSLLDSFGAQTPPTKESNKEAAPNAAGKVAPPTSSYAEPDMSAFDFGT